MFSWCNFELLIFLVGAILSCYFFSWCNFELQFLVGAI